MSEATPPESPEPQAPPDSTQLSDRAAEVHCPRCEAEMVFGEVLGTKVVVCRGCAGTMIRSAEFGPLVESLRRLYHGSDDPPHPISPSELEIAATCPVCREKMSVHPYYGPGNIVIDSCASCMVVWLDGAELGRVMRGPGRR